MDQIHAYENFIDGKWVEPHSGEYYVDINPADNDDSIGSFPLSDAEDVRKAVESAHAAFPSWARMKPADREKYIFRFSELLEQNKGPISEAICREEGKTLKEARGEPERGVEETRFFIGEGRRLEGITMPSDREGVVSVATRIPIGVVAAINPWNFPVLTPLRKIIPAIVTGNTVVFKPANDTPLSAVLLMRLFEQAGLPPGVVNLVIGKGGSMGDALAGNPLVAGITFTGSTAVGRRINTVAATHFAKVQLEMGGKNPAIVAGYKNLDYAAAQITAAAFAVSGQRCTSISRVIVLESEAEILENKIAEKMKSYVLGNGMDPKVSMGPVINRDAGEKIMSYIEGAKAAGATIKVGGNQRKGGIYDKGFYIEPTLITDVTPEMDVAIDEIFGPVLVSLKVRSFEEAMKVANGSEYGLAAALFTDNLAFIDAFQRDIETGMTHVNHGTVTDSSMPFGGVKGSGLGPFSKGATNKDFFTTYKVNYTKFA